MAAFVQSVLDLISQHPHLAGLLAFACAAAESIAILGALLPGSSILVGLGTLVGMGHLALWPILAWSVAGAIAGDGISFWFGHRYRGHIRQMWPFSRRPELLARGEAFFLRYGARSVLFGRFMPLMRAIVPIVAGVMGMRPTRFYAANALSALAWSPAHVLPGVLFGAALASLGEVSGRLVGLVIGLVVASLVVIWFARLAIAASLRGVGTLQLRATGWARRRNDGLGQVALHLVAPDHADLRLLLLLNAVLAAALFGSVALLRAIPFEDALLQFDIAFSQFVQSLRTPWTDALMVAASGLGDYGVTLLIASVGALWLIARRQYNLALGLALAMAATAAFVAAMTVVARMPPDTTIVGGASELFLPGGHTALAAALYGILGWIAWRSLPVGLARALVALLVVVVATIATSRVYLGVRWPSDVVAGLLFAAGAVGLFALVFRATAATVAHQRGLLAVCAAALIVVGATHIAGRYRLDLQRYGSRPISVTQMDLPWRDGGWRDLPTARIDTVGTTREPLVLQWRGAAPALAAALTAEGWRTPPDWSVATIDSFAVGRIGADRLPVLPAFHNGRAPALTLLLPAVEDGQEGRYVLRAWPEPADDPGGKPASILVGSVVFETIDHPLGQLSLPLRDEAAGCDAGPWLARLPGAVPVGAPLAPNDGGCGGRIVLAGD